MYAAAAVKLPFSIGVLRSTSTLCAVGVVSVCLWPCVRRVADEIRFRGGWGVRADRRFNPVGGRQTYATP